VAIIVFVRDTQKLRIGAFADGILRRQRRRTTMVPAAGGDDMAAGVFARKPDRG
jgi:hypothetical protein